MVNISKTPDPKFKGGRIGYLDMFKKIFWKILNFDLIYTQFCDRRYRITLAYLIILINCLRKVV